MIQYARSSNCYNNLHLSYGKDPYIFGKKLSSSVFVFIAGVFYLFQFNIFMTHLSNYGNDRLALYMFESAIKFVECWTNLKLKQVTPIEMGMKYFDMFPEESDPVWRVSQ